MLLVEKYKPRTLQEIRGQQQGVARLKQALLQKESVFLQGGVGTGKTSAVYAASRELDWEIFEFNASEARNKEAVQRILAEVVGQQSLLSKEKLILVDDVDALSGVYDRGGLQALQEIVKESRFPFVFTTSNEDERCKQLKRQCKVIDFLPVEHTEVYALLREVCEQEGMLVDEQELWRIARACAGDCRQGLQMLEIANVEHELEISTGKDHHAALEDFLQVVFRSKNAEAIATTFDRLDEGFDDVMLWLEENLPAVYSARELAGAYDALSRADVMKGRIRKRQYYRLLVYQKMFMSLGVALAKQEQKRAFTPYKRPGRLLKIWIANRSLAKKKSICGKMGEKLHLSRKKAVQEFLFMRRFLLGAADFLELDAEELAYLQKR